MMTVKAHDGYYDVTASSRDGIQSFLISKNDDGKVECTCGREKCPHQAAVRAYIGVGGTIARPANVETQNIVRVRRCPICQAKVVEERGTTWRCIDSNTHFFEWLDEQHSGAVRKWMCGEGREAWDKIIGEDNVQTGGYNHEPTEDSRGQIQGD